MELLIGNLFALSHDSLHELDFGVELDPNVIFLHSIIARSIPI